MIKVIGIKFRNNGKIYYFDPKDEDIEKGDCAIVETARGVEYGQVFIAPKEVDENEIVAPLKPVIRKATEKDSLTYAENLEKAKKAFDVCLEKIAKHGLEMKLIDVEYTFDRNKILFYFTADGKVDFRELVKDLASVYRTRIELRQIGVRDETKTMGGYGICGREFCCHSWQRDFVPVSIKMAKDQNMSLNPTKISGSCGRLMCCIKYEEDTYKELLKNLPKAGDETVTEDGYHGVVDNVNVLRQKVRVIVDTENGGKEARTYDAGELEFTKKKKKPNNPAPEKEDEKIKPSSAEDPAKKTQPEEGAQQKENGGKKDYKDRKNYKGRKDSKNKGGHDSAKPKKSTDKENGDPA